MVPFWQRVPSPPARLPARSGTPQTHLLQGTGGPRRPPAARRRPPAAARLPPRSRPRRPWLKDQSAGRWLAGCMLRGGRPRGAGGRASFSSTRAAQGPAACAREDSRYGPGRGARPPLLRIRQRGRVETVPTPGPRGPRPRPDDLRARSPALRPPDSRLLAPSAPELRSSDARTNGRADRRAGTWAGGWRAGGGSQGCSARKQRGPSAGPRSGRGKRRRGSGLGRDSAPGRGPRGVEGGRAGGRRRPARPPVSLSWAPRWRPPSRRSRGGALDACPAPAPRTAPGLLSQSPGAPQIDQLSKSDRVFKTFC